jgi:hypothetical protein
MECCELLLRVECADFHYHVKHRTPNVVQSRLYATERPRISDIRVWMSFVATRPRGRLGSRPWEYLGIARGTGKLAIRTSPRVEVRTSNKNTWKHQMFGLRDELPVLPDESSDVYERSAVSPTEPSSPALSSFFTSPRHKPTSYGS